MRISDIGMMELSGMEFHAYHGCLEKEKKDGNLFIVDFSAEYWLKKAARTDNLDDAADYSEIYKLIKAEMAKPSNLLENVAGRIIDSIRENFDCKRHFIRMKVKVSKKNPPVDGICAWSSITAYYDGPMSALSTRFDQKMI